MADDAEPPGDAASQALEPLRCRVIDLEERAKAEDARQTDELAKVMEELAYLAKFTERLEAQSELIGEGFPMPPRVGNRDTTSVEWTIGDFAKKERTFLKGDSTWSPSFAAAGMKGLRLEFFPRGREKTTMDGFCSLFLWCPAGVTVKYQLKVGSILRSPDEDTFSERVGHGHSNFCLLAPQINASSNCVVVGVDFLDVTFHEKNEDVDPYVQTLQLVPTSWESLMSKELTTIANRGVQRVVWRIDKMSERLKHMPRGSAMWSPLFSAGGVREILLEFYPNGSTNTTKDGYCAFYVRCPIGVQLTVTLFVGRIKKGPIRTSFDSLTGKGLPDFCEIDQKFTIGADGSLEVGIELRNQPATTLLIS